MTGLVATSGSDMQPRRVDVEVEVEALGRVRMATTVFLPDVGAGATPSAALFLYPGGGYGRGYFDITWPGLSGYSQAAHHVAHGFVVIACDHLGVGDSEQPADRSSLTHAAVAAANHAVAVEILSRLVGSTLVDDYPPASGLAAIGVGHSLGACILTVQQARHRTFAGVGLLGWSGTWSTPPAPGDVVEASTRWVFHADDAPQELVDADMSGGYPIRTGAQPPLGQCHHARSDCCDLLERGVCRRGRRGDRRPRIHWGRQS